MSTRYGLEWFSRTKIRRDVMARHIPPEVAEPAASWFKGETIDFARRTLLDADVPLFESLDRDAVTGLVQDHLAGRQNRRLLTWAPLIFEPRLKTFMA